MSGRGLASFWRTRLFVAALICFVPAAVPAQNLMAPQAAVPAPLTPGTGTPGATMMSPVPLAAPPSSPPVAQVTPIVPAGHVALAVAARYGRDAPAIVWRPDLARLCGQGRHHRRVSLDQGRPRRGADFHPAARQLRRACELGAGQRRQGDPAARRHGPRNVRYSRRRRAARGPRRRRAHSPRADCVRHLPGQPIRHLQPPAAGAERGHRRRRAVARGHLLHRLELRRGQFRGALGRARAGRQAHRHRRHPPRRGADLQAGERVQAARRSPIRNGPCSLPAATSSRNRSAPFPASCSPRAIITWSRATPAKPISATSRSSPASTARSRCWRGEGAQAACFIRATSGGTASCASIASAASSGITCWPSLPRRRIETVRSAASLRPTTSSTGTFASECSRTL